jgi:hypothetical protein
MSVTTFGDLLSEAEVTVCALAAQRQPEPGPLLAAWPAFCHSAMHAIRATTGDRDPRWYAVDLLGLEAARASAAVRPLIDRTDPETEPSLVRAATVLAAAGDLLAPTNPAQPHLAPARVLGRFTTDVERVFVRVGGQAGGRPAFKLAAAEWASDDVVIPGLAEVDDDQAYRAMDLLADDATQAKLWESVFFAVTGC